MANPLDYLNMGGAGPYDPDQSGPNPKNQQPVDPNTGMASPFGPAPGTGTTPAGQQVQPNQDPSKPKDFQYDWTKKPGENALNYLGTQLSPLFQSSTPQVQGGSQSSGAPNVGTAAGAGAGLPSGEGKNQGGIAKFASMLGAGSMS